MTITGGYDLEVSGIYCLYNSPTIRGCVLTGNRSGMHGFGAVIAGHWSDMLVEDCVISRNDSEITDLQHVGALSFLGGYVVVSRCVVSDNVGRGIYCRGGAPRIQQCDIRRNRTTGDGGGVLGGEFGSPVFIEDCVISHNFSAGLGGGVRMDDQGVLKNCRIEENTSLDAGGGVHVHSASSSLEYALIENCAIVGNHAVGAGGGVNAYLSDKLRILNSVIAENRSDLRGGGVYMEVSHGAVMTNCTLVGNRSSEGGAGLDLDSTALTLTNSIVWGHGGRDVFLEGNAQLLATYGDIQGGWEGEGNLDIDPGFALAEDEHVLANSPCVDAGTDQVPGGLTPEDLDGNARVLDGDGNGNAAADIGAYEFNRNVPSIAVSRSFEVVVPEGATDPIETTLQLRNCGGQELQWRVETDDEHPWLRVEPNQGSSWGEIDEVTVIVDPDGLLPGLYRSRLIVDATEAVNTPRTVDVDVFVHGTLRVPQDRATIQEALDAGFDGVTVLVADGIYAGPGNRELDFKGHAITLRSQNGPEACVIDCERLGRGFIFESGEDADAVVDGFTVRNGWADVHGGGFRIVGSSVTIKNCVIENNTVGGFGGGGISATNSSVILMDCILRNNEGRGASFGGGASRLDRCEFRNNTKGGADFGSSVVQVRQCSFVGNGADGYEGGGVTFHGEGVVEDCVITDNQAQYGGGVFCRLGQPRFVRCVISRNVAQRVGGGFCCQLVGDAVLIDCVVGENHAGSGGGLHSSDQSQPYLLNSRFSGNVAGVGGGIYADTKITVMNCVFSANHADLDGGAFKLWWDKGKPQIADCTIYGNTADGAGGGFHLDKGDIVTKLVNTILWGNRDETGLTESAQIHVVSGPPAVNYSCVQGWTGDLGGNGNLGDDPLFVDPLGPDGVLGTDDDDLRLGSGSPCIDAANNNAVLADDYDLDGDEDVAEPVPFDITGLPRFFDDPMTADTGNGAPPLVDMGAYEYQGGVDCDLITRLKVACQAGQFKVKGVVLSDLPKDVELTMTLDGARPKTRATQANGKAVFRWAGVDPGAHEACLVDCDLCRTTECGP